MATSRVRIRPEIAALTAYRQGRPAAPGGYKLSANENPFPPIPAVLEAIAASSVNRYPDAAATQLRARLAARHGVTEGRVQVGPGSVAILHQLADAVIEPGGQLLFAWRSFEHYPILATVARAEPVPVPLLPDGRHDLDAMAAAVTDRTRIVVVCSPNNPTGPAVTTEEFRRFMAAVPPTVLVLLDEAYAEFVTDAAIVHGADELAAHDNLVVLRTFSKAYGLAGLRLGYALGPEAVLDAARSAAVPLSVIEPAQRAGLAALDHEQELLERVRLLAAERDRVRDALIGQGWPVPEAQGNFVWLPTGADTERAASAFAAAGLAVRAFPPDGIRITVAEHDAVGALLEVAGELAGVGAADGPSSTVGTAPESPRG